MKKYNIEDLKHWINTKHSALSANYIVSFDIVVEYLNHLGVKDSIETIKFLKQGKDVDFNQGDSKIKLEKYDEFYFELNEVDG